MIHELSLLQEKLVLRLHAESTPDHQGKRKKSGPPLDSLQVSKKKKPTPKAASKENDAKAAANQKAKKAAAAQIAKNEKKATKATAAKKESNGGKESCCRHERAHTSIKGNIRECSQGTRENIEGYRCS